ncbi:hypothetical protein [Streptomyces sp. NPDC060194]|uniref:hypothetical protein n=1 Tax=Streptomyces sp. NPDC060194 TaxID=3347069 RepID=UPI003646F043
MRIELATDPGDPERPNEDWASVALPASGLGGTLVLLDGVTPPAGPTGCAHSVPWFTARLGGALAELSGSRGDLTLPEVLGAGIARTAEAHRATCDLSHVRTPQATVVMARWDAVRVEYLVLSDSVLLVEGAGGAVEPVLDVRLSGVTQELRGGVRELPAGSPERAAAVRAYVAAVEARRNVEGGFHTAAADPGVAARAVHGWHPRADVSALVALTDGAGRWVDVFGRGTWADAFALVRKQGPQSFIDTVRELERGAPAGLTGKRHDDAAVVLADL